MNCLSVLFGLNGVTAHEQGAKSFQGSEHAWPTLGYNELGQICKHKYGIYAPKSH